MGKQIIRKTKSVTYNVKIWFIDSTYWDDGNRSNSRAFLFTSKRDALNYIEIGLKNGFRVYGQGGSLVVRPTSESLDQVTVEEVVTTRMSVEEVVTTRMSVEDFIKKASTRAGKKSTAVTVSK